MHSVSRPMSRDVHSEISYKFVDKSIGTHQADDIWTFSKKIAVFSVELPNVAPGFWVVILHFLWPGLGICALKNP